MHRSVLGLDIGGANLKAAHTDGAARLVPFELWKNPAGLAPALRSLIADLPAYDLLAVTMTGELCDCFETRRDGVNHILDAVAAVTRGVTALVWLTDNYFACLDTARQKPLLAASSNWAALVAYARWFARYGWALLVDVGSTTTDIVPMFDGQPGWRGRTDAERLQTGELVYTGVRRTPVSVLMGGEGVMAEGFATTLDVYLMLGEIPEDPHDCRTADGRPATRACSHARLARMLGTDADSCSPEEIEKFARAVALRQEEVVRRALKRALQAIPDDLAYLVLSGSGEFLARKVGEALIDRRLVQVRSLSERLGPVFSQAACAYAVAMLASDYEGD